MAETSPLATFAIAACNCAIAARTETSTSVPFIREAPLAVLSTRLGLSTASAGYCPEIEYMFFCGGGKSRHDQARPHHFRLRRRACRQRGAELLLPVRRSRPLRDRTRCEGGARSVRRAQHCRGPAAL